MGRPSTLPNVADARPDLALDWHPTNDKTPAQVSVGAKYRALWKCRNKITIFGRRRACGYEWTNAVQNRARAGQGCPACAGKAAHDWNNLAILHPHLVKEWSDKNTLAPHEVTPGSGYIAIWECLCGHKWPAQVDKRVGRGHNCPRCSKRGPASPTNNLALAAVPTLLRDWHPRNPKTPADYRPQANVTVWWKCHNTITFQGAPRACGYDWSASLKSRFKGAGCPACAGLAATDWNNVGVTDSHLLPQWHGDNVLLPQDVTRGSHKKIVWQCLVADCQHVWPAEVHNRTRGKGCPACAGLVVTERNNFAVKHPRYLPQWADTNKLGPHEITPGSDYRADWICTNTITIDGLPVQCARRWTTRAANRINGTDCPDCMLWGTSRDEMFLAYELAAFLTIEHGASILGASHTLWKTDIVVPDLRIVVEYDGSYWHREQVERDTRKTVDLTAAGWQVIRVRECPLAPITSHDVTCATGQYKTSAVTVLTRIQELTGEPIAGLDVYASHARLVNNVAARTAADELRANVLKQRLKRQQRRAKA